MPPKKTERRKKEKEERRKKAQATTLEPEKQPAPELTPEPDPEPPTAPSPDVENGGDAVPQAPGGDDDVHQVAGDDGEAGDGAVPQATGDGDSVPQTYGGGDAVPQGAGGDDGEVGADHAEPPPRQPTRGKGKGKSKGKSKAKPTQAAAGEETTRQDYSLTQEQEEDLVEWMRENEGVWRRGHRLYKTRRTLWAVKAEQFGVTIEHLEGWWKSVKDWFVKLMKKKSGDARKKLTDRELWILDHISFYTPQLRSNEGESQPMSHLQRQEPRTQPQPEPRPLPPLDSDSGSEHLQPSHQSLEGLEASATREAGEAGPSSYSQRSRGRKRRRHETAEDEWMQELRDSIKANTAMMAQLVQQKPPVSDREPFITYVQDSLRTLPDDQYELVRAKITSLLHSLTQTAVDRPPQSQSAPPQPAGQFLFQPSPSQQLFSQAPPPQQPPFSQHPLLQQPSFNQALPPQQPPFSQHPPPQQQTVGPSRSSESSFSQLLSSDNYVLDVNMPMNLSAISMDSQFGPPSQGRSSSQSLNTPPAPRGAHATNTTPASTEEDGRTFMVLQHARGGGKNDDEDSDEQ